MDGTYIILGIFAWWTFAVVALWVLFEKHESPLVRLAMFGSAVCWPLLVPIMLVALPYRALVSSARTIRSDLRNRKLLKEFEEFLAAKAKSEGKA